MKRWFLLLCLAGCSSATSTPSDPSTDMNNNDVTISINAKQWQFDPSVIHATKGQALVIELKSLDRVHGFSIPDLNVRTDVKPGEMTRIRIVPDKAGTFTFHCDVFCGDGHEGMSGQLIVE